MSLLTVLGLWVALSFLATPLIGAFIYRQTRVDRGYPATTKPATSLESFGFATSADGTVQISARRHETAVRPVRGVRRPLGMPARTARPILQ